MAEKVNHWFRSHVIWVTNVLNGDETIGMIEIVRTGRQCSSGFLRQLQPSSGSNFEIPHTSAGQTHLPYGVLKACSVRDSRARALYSRLPCIHCTIETVGATASSARPGNAGIRFETVPCRAPGGLVAIEPSQSGVLIVRNRAAE